MSEDLVLSLRHVTSGYRDGGLFRRGAVQEVLHDVSFDVRHGEILGLVGESGTANLPWPGRFWVCSARTAGKWSTIPSGPR